MVSMLCRMSYIVKAVSCIDGCWHQILSLLLHRLSLTGTGLANWDLRSCPLASVLCNKEFLFFTGRQIIRHPEIKAWTFFLLVNDL